MTTLEDAIAEATRNKRICPMPPLWNQLYELLPNRKRKGFGWEPALPLILAAWHEASGLSKALRLKEHLEWAESHGALDQVYTFMISLSERDWYHFGD